MLFAMPLTDDAAVDVDVLGGGRRKFCGSEHLDLHSNCCDVASILKGSTVAPVPLSPICFVTG